MSPLKRRYEVGESVGKWRVLGRLGAGAMGIVYEVEHRVTGKPGALKVLKVVGKGADVAASKMMAEAKLLGRQHHRNLVAVHDAGDGTDGHGHWMVMEKLVGRDLSDVIRQEGALSLDRALHYAEQIAAAASCAHSAGVVHRDLKPDNIHVSETEVLKVFDFGASRFRQGATLGGATGTIPYMSPEQLHKDAALDGRSDVYALGLILYEMLKGRHLYQLPDGGWRDRGQVIYHIASGEPVSDFEDMDPRVRPLLLRATAKNRNERYPTMDAMAGDLQQLRKTVSRLYAPTERLTDAQISAARQANSIVRTSPMSSTQAAVVAQATVPRTAPPQPRYVRAAALVAAALAALATGVVLVLVATSDTAGDSDSDSKTAATAATVLLQSAAAVSASSSALTEPPTAPTAVRSTLNSAEPASAPSTAPTTTPTTATTHRPTPPRNPVVRPHPVVPRSPPPPKKPSKWNTNGI